jgi:glycosyltransferase involved in cell wall biosynthesis
MSYTVVIPARANCNFISECLKSVYGQTLLPDEVKIVFDESDQNLNSATSLIKRQFPNVKICMSTKSGMISAINLGIKLSETEYVSFLDSDDLWTENKQMDQIKELDRDQTIDVVTSNARNFIMNRLEMGGSGKWVQASTFTSATFRNSAFDKYGLVDEGSTHFTWLYRWWSNANNLGINRSHINSPGLNRRIHSKNSWTLQNSTAHGELFKELRLIMNQQDQKQG